MKRFLGVIAAAVSAGGVMAAAAPPVSAATGHQITTYTNTFLVKLTGTSDEKGYYLSTDYRSVVIMSPRLAFYVETVKAARQTTGPTTTATMQWYFVGGRNYIKDNGARGWQKSTPTVGDIRTYGNTSSVRVIIDRLFALPGLFLASAGHYYGIDTIAQIGAFLSYTYGVSQEFLSVNDFTIVTVSFWVNSDGWPVSLVIAGSSPDMRLNIGDTFTYNRPATIKAP